MLHVAPEPQLRKALTSRPDIAYLSCDLDARHAMMPADLQDLPFRDDWFDGVICCHVLEHIEDDRRGMREIFRVLKPGAWAILQVPIALALGQTIEDPGLKDEAERIRRFGQRDHLRLYSPTDYLLRLRDSGFTVWAIPYPRRLGPELIARYALTADEVICLCRKDRPVSDRTLSLTTGIEVSFNEEAAPRTRAASPA
jgi:SAM-dependent methyltransferase